MGGPLDARPDLLVTTCEVVLGLAAALVLGTALAVGDAPRTGGRHALRPLVVGSQAVPIPVLAPLIVLVLGFGLAPKILIVALICFFPIVVNLADGLRDSDPDARSCCARWTPRAGSGCASSTRRPRFRRASPG